MSRAEPMDSMEDAWGYSRRLVGYVNQQKPSYTRSMHVVTARQWRRYWHKAMRASSEHEPVDVDTPPAMRPKGRPTPRQRKPRRDG